MGVVSWVDLLKGFYHLRCVFHEFGGDFGIGWVFFE